MAFSSTIMCRGLHGSCCLWVAAWLEDLNRSLCSLLSSCTSFLL